MNEFIYCCICLWPLCTFLSLATHLLHKTFSRWIDFGSVKENQSRIKFQRQLTLKLLEFSLFLCACKNFWGSYVCYPTAHFDADSISKSIAKVSTVTHPHYLSERLFRKKSGCFRQFTVPTEQRNIGRLIRLLCF